MAYTLMVSRDCGMNYGVDRTADNLDDLEARAEELDQMWLRWYVEQDGEMLFTYACAIHKHIITFMSSAQSEAPNAN